jgi:hypothetical protein
MNRIFRKISTYKYDQFVAFSSRLNPFLADEIIEDVKKEA